MTYKALAKIINEWSDDFQEMDLTIWLSDCDEYVPATLCLNKTDDRLDEGHPVIIY